MSIDLGIDLGTTKIIIYRAGKGVVLEEPSVVACNTRTSEVVAVGHEALRMMGRAPAYIQIECPVREGVISNHEFTEFLIKEFVRKVAGSFLIRPRIAICIPSAITRVEARAVVEAAVSAGARKVFLIDEPIAAAIGAGIDVTKPVGRMMVDLGGGTTDIAVISMGGIIVSASLKIAGNSFDEAIVRYIENTYKLAIGTTVGEQLKKEIGCVFEPQPDIKTTIRGRNLITGIPEEISVSQAEICDVLRPLADEIVTGVKQVLGRTPPELSGDILTEGILMTGGTAQLRGLSDLIEHATGIATTVARDPVSCVGIGTGKCFSLIGELKEGFELASGGGRS
jgi:rod shape-determining protein MreB